MKRLIDFCLLPALCVLLSACGPVDEPAPSGFAGLGQDAADYAQVERGRELVFPADHGAHDGYRIEWWYITANLADEQGRDWGVQWTLFRTALRPGDDEPGWRSANLWMGHAGITGPLGHRHAEIMARGGIGQAGVRAEPFHAWIDDWELTGARGQGLDTLRMQAGGDDFDYSLQLDAQGPLVLHGDNGYSEKSGQGQASYYYSQPFYTVSGEVWQGGEQHTVTGTAWLDREWSSQPLAAEQDGWDWFSLHLTGGNKLMLFQVREADGNHYRAGTWIDADGRSRTLDGEAIDLQPLGSTRQDDGRDVPTRWRVRIAELDVDVEVEAVEGRAWMGGTFEYWEGPVRVDGGNGGRGYLEMTGY